MLLVHFSLSIKLSKRSSTVLFLSRWRAACCFFRTIRVCCLYDDAVDSFIAFIDRRVVEEEGEESEGNESLIFDTTTIVTVKE